MLTIYKTTEIKEWDNFTIQNEPINAIELMERAATACVEWLVNHISPEFKINIICGNGNNGGDGFAIGRLLLHYNYRVTFFISNSDKRSVDNLSNLRKIESYNPSIINIIEEESILSFSESDIIIDCIFGIGFKFPIDNYWINVINSINNSGCKIISIDMPSGLISEPDFAIESNNNEIIKAWHTLTFQTPKLSLLLPGWGDFAGNFTVIDIKLHEKFVELNPSKFNYFTINDAKQKLIKRNRFSHKGNYGHALIVAGGEGKCGAATMSTKACIKSGAGLVTLLSQEQCSRAVNIAVPEVMTQNSKHNFEKFSAIGVGPGIGIDEEALKSVKEILETKCQLVIDADAITLIFKNKIKIPENSIITPHPKEFDSFAGKSQNSYERFKKALQIAKDNNFIIVLKGANTAVFSPDGTVSFNSSGNPGMATAGSGDVLTGIITSFVSQGYSAKDAAVLGVFVHGMAGDLAAEYNSVTGLSAMDIIDFLNPAFKELEN